uniref:Uncharacterized protein n=1 Tax=Candidatus Methanogaster sp. ANME-2c ERB4 TaxID=2759911 RepID=A0A7G9Y6B2_9EURY|nr:hypothetical protein HMEJMANM_00015 [Methanosarcinales archaeon ANME-2c ERB4]QNO43629.1 hypothetical protein LAPIAFBC_00036 [Methanosarcinales archaeon ANME-2c ERB4]
MLELVDDALQLLVEHAAVSDDDHRIKDLLVTVVVQACKPVRQPCDGVALPAPCRMLHKIVIPCARRPRIQNNLPHGIELMITGEDHRLTFDLLAADLPLLDLKVDEPRQYIHETVPLKHLLPEICSLVAPLGFQGCQRRYHCLC